MGKVKNPGVGRGRGPRSPQVNRTRVPVEDVQKFLRRLRRPPRVLSTESISEATGVSRRTIRNILAGKVRFVNPETARVLFETQYPIGLAQTQPMVNGVGSVRRLRALARAGGWSPATLAPHVGVHRTTLQRIRTRNPDRVSRETAVAIARAYDELWDVPCREGNVLVVIEHAKEQRWWSPLAWDDEEIDDPAARPQGVVGWVKKTA